MPLLAASYTAMPLTSGSAAPSPHHARYLASPSLPSNKTRYDHVGAQFADPTQMTIYDLSTSPVRVSRAPLTVASVSPRATGLNGSLSRGFRLTPRFGARSMLVSHVCDVRCSFG